MKIRKMKALEKLLMKYRDDSVDQEEYEKRNELLYDVRFEIEANTPPEQINTADEKKQCCYCGVYQNERHHDKCQFGAGVFRR